MGDCCSYAHPFRICSGLRFLGYAMILLVAAIAGVSYYAVIVVAWGPQLLHGGLLSLLATAIVVLFHFLLVLLLWSYFMVVFHDPGSVPVGWQPLSKRNYLELDNSVILADHTAIDTRESEISPTGGSGRRPNVRYCSHCQNNKPPRCHHCSVCQKCVLKMDHHCVWVVNCVGARNYKFFLLFLFYTFLETILDSLALLPHFIKFFGDARNHSGSPGNLAVTFISFVLNVAFTLSLLCFVIMHTSLVLSNTTTIEVYEKKNVVEWTYDLGKRKNFEQIWKCETCMYQKKIESAETKRAAGEANNGGWFGVERPAVLVAAAMSMTGAGLMGWWVWMFRSSHQQMWMVPVSLVMFGTPVITLFSTSFAAI